MDPRQRSRGSLMGKNTLEVNVCRHLQRPCLPNVDITSRTVEPFSVRQARGSCPGVAVEGEAHVTDPKLCAGIDLYCMREMRPSSNGSPYRCDLDQ